jgi:hypothetical protein
VLAWIAAGRGQHERAATVLGAAEELARRWAPARPDLVTYHQQVKAQTRKIRANNNSRLR